MEVPFFEIVDFMLRIHVKENGKIRMLEMSKISINPVVEKGVGESYSNKVRGYCVNLIKQYHVR